MKNILKSLAVGVAAFGLVSCSTADQNAGTLGAATGAVIGGVTTGNIKGAAVGAAIGAGAGVLIGRVLNGNNECYYRDRRGRRYIARCR